MEIPVNRPWIGPTEEGCVLDALRSGWVTTGPYCDRLEEEFARWVGRKYAVACSSGTAALWLALKAFGVTGDVLTQAYACDAVANATINATGSAPIVVDVDKETWGLAANGTEAELLDDRRRIQAVILVHSYGVPARDTERIVELCKQRGIPLIEDASESHGAILGGAKVGTFGTAAVFSLRGEKNLSGGQLGIVLTDDRDLAALVHQYAHNGLPSDAVRYWSSVAGMNFQPSNLNAALACAQLSRAEALVAAKVRVHEGWRHAFRDTPYVEFQAPHGSPSWWLTAIIIDESVGMLPQDLALALLERGIATRPGFYPLSWLPHCRQRPGSLPIPVSERLLRQVLVLPSGYDVSMDDQERVATAIKEIVGQ